MGAQRCTRLNVDNIHVEDAGRQAGPKPHIGKLSAGDNVIPDQRFQSLRFFIWLGQRRGVNALDTALSNHYISTMSKSHKQMVTITIPQRDYLREVAKRLGVSLSEVIRQAIDKMKAGSK